MKRHTLQLCAFAILLALIISFLPAQAGQVYAISPDIVISQVYGGGGNTGATLKNDFIELYNRGSAPVNISGWTVQYASSTGVTWSKTGLIGTIQPGEYFLIQEAAGAGGTVDLPTPNATGILAMSATSGKVALVSNGTTLTGSCPAGVVDFVGYGAADCSEVAPAPVLSNTTAALRNANGAADTDNNSADFTAGTPNPRNTPALDAAPFVATIVPAKDAVNVLLGSDITITFNEPVDVAGSWFLLSCLTSGIHTAVVTGGPATFTINPDVDFAYGEGCALTIFASLVTDQDQIDPPNAMAGNYIIGFTTVSSPVAIHDIQGGAHLSPKNAQAVNTQGIVTALRTTGSTRGFYLQDPNPDANPATSEGIFVFTGSTSSPASLVAVGDLVQITAKVSEFRGATASLTLTELVAPYTITKISSGNALPAPVVLGTGGLIPPSTVIEDDATGSVETTGVFDPASDGIDFYESLEGMLVQVNDAVAVGPRNDFTSNREIAVVGDNGANAGIRTNRGGIIAQANDFNPERIILNDWITGPLPAANVGDTFPGATVGVIDYSFNNFKLQVISMPGLVSGGLAQEVAPAAGSHQISVAAFNVENLAPTDPQSKFDTLAELIVNHLQSPDILSIEEIQDNNGVTNDGVVDSSTTWNMLIAAIQAAGGPVYEFRQIDPVNNQDGGAPGGNIRVGFLFRTDRGLSFVDRAGATPTTANAVTGFGEATQLLYSPGRIDPTNAAFNASRKPLAAEFLFEGQRLFVIANHWNSKSGDQPLFGVNQPPVFSSEVQRNQQAAIVHDFVNAILTADPAASVIVMGDLNDFQFSSALATLKGSPAILTAMIETLPLVERYSYVYEGNSETLDHILVSDAVIAQPYVYDVVHVNSEFANQASDHEPQVMIISFNTPPTADAGGPYTVDEGQSVAVSATGSDPEDGALTYAWDLDNNGTFETVGQSVAFAGVDGPSDQTIAVQVMDNGGLSATATATVHVSNVAPAATFTVPASVDEGSAIALALVNPVDVPADLIGLQYAFDCGAGYGPFDATSTASCATDDNGAHKVGAKIMDKDGGVTEYTAKVIVKNVPPAMETPVASPEPSIEGQSVTASAAFTDPGLNDAPFTCSVNFGDGSGSQPGAVIGSLCHAPAHVYPTFGLYSVTFSITDKDGDTGSNSVPHFVIFNWTGFFPPLENLPAWNSANAGQAIPVKFSLGGNKGLNIFVPNSPLSVEVSCDPVAQIGADLPTVTPGSSDLTYSAGGQYIYVWKTEKAWAGTCRQLVIKLIDGTEHRVNVKFK